MNESDFDQIAEDTMVKQAPLTQIWVAARSGGYHFDYDAAEECWRLQGNGEELFSCLSRYCSEQAGEDVVLG
jgi:CyaY protein